MIDRIVVLMPAEAITQIASLRFHGNHTTMNERPVILLLNAEIKFRAVTRRQHQAAQRSCRALRDPANDTLLSQMRYRVPSIVDTGKQTRFAGNTTLLIG